MCDRRSWNDNAHLVSSKFKLPMHYLFLHWKLLSIKWNYLLIPLVQLYHFRECLSSHGIRISVLGFASKVCKFPYIFSVLFCAMWYFLTVWWKALFQCCLTVIKRETLLLFQQAYFFVEANRNFGVDASEVRFRNVLFIEIKFFYYMTYE